METFIILAFVLLGVAFYTYYSKHSQLTSEGKIIDRERKFMEQAEDFTLSSVDTSQISGALRNISYSEMQVTMTADEQKQSFRFTYSNFVGEWQAVLYRMEAPSGQLTYRFQFIHWKLHDGAVIGFLQMNQLLTAVEKMFLSIDPTTQVRSVFLETKTSHKIF